MEDAVEIEDERKPEDGSPPPVAEQKETGTALIRALRRSGDEAQFTQAIAALASTDSGFARGFVEACLDLAERGPAGGAVTALRAEGLPEKFECRAEHSLYDRDQARGRVDLRFDGGDLTLLVENKLHSGYGNEQLSQYLQALNALPRGDTRSGLIAITRDVPTQGEEAVTGHPRWLGSIRWAHLLTRLRRLSIEDKQLRNEWHELLTVMEEDGDLGTTRANIELTHAWVDYLRGRDHLVHLLGQIWSPVLDFTQREVKLRHRVALTREQVAQPLTKTKRQHVVKSTQAYVYFEFTVPASKKNESTLHVGFERGPNGDLLFTVWVYPLDGLQRLDDGDRQLRRAVKDLEQSGFKQFNGWWARYFSQDEFLEHEDVPARLVELAQEAIGEICESRVLRGDIDAFLAKRRRRR